MIPEQRHLDVSLTQARVDAIFQALVETRGRRRSTSKPEPRQPNAHS